MSRKSNVVKTCGDAVCFRVVYGARALIRKSMEEKVMANRPNTRAGMVVQV
jgi:hypothetical protein